ncbi:MAG: sensor histidine kinase [Wujia sp.]
MEDAREKFEAIQSANQIMLDYFNKAFLSKLEEIQGVKTQIFEIDIKLDELDKTKDIYAFKTNSKKSVFSPMLNEGVDTARNQIIEEQKKDYLSIKESLHLQIRSLELELNKYRKYLESLNQASDALSAFEPKYTGLDPEHTDTNGFTFVQNSVNDDISAHGYNILMLDAYNRALIQTMMDKNVRSKLESMSNKIEMINYMLGTDIGRARLTLQDILHSNQHILHALDDVEKKLTQVSDTSKSTKEQIEDFLNEFKRENPALSIQASIEMPVTDVAYHPIFVIQLMRLLQMIFDNVTKHANATQVTLKASLTPNIIEVIVTDDGVGIKDDYLTESPWYSSLHQAKEILYMLCGKFDVSGDLMHGTTVKFSFPIQK